MYIQDYHLHTNYSEDSSADVLEMVESAIKKGITEIAITDHMEFDYPPVSYWEGVLPMPFSQQMKILQSVKVKNADRITILRGIEIGLQPHIKKEVDNFANEHELDFIIGSAHVVDWIDLYDGNFFEGKTKHEAYTRYFEYVLRTIEIHDNFDVYGHLDFIIRYGTYEDNSLNYSDFADIIDTILTCLIQKRKGIEVNTSGYRYGLNSPNPQFDIVKRYRELGGEIITIGSDAHTPKDVGIGLNRGIKLIKEAGFSHITSFNKRVPNSIAI